MVGTSIIILNYNGRKHLEQFLPFVVRYAEGAEIVIADNASTDDSVPFLKKEYPDLRLIQLKENHGFAGGYNEALKEVDAEFYILLNSDVEVTKGWLSPLITFLRDHPEYAACQPKILDYNRREYFEHAGASGGFVDHLGYPFCRGRIFTQTEKDTGQYDEVVDIFWATGACMVIRADLFYLAGGFDSDFFAHMEEIDLCWRLHEMNYKIAAVPQAKVYHLGGGTLAKLNYRKTYLNFRNNLSLLLKNLPVTSLLYILPLRICLDLSAALSLWINYSFAHFKAVINAYLYFGTHFAYISTKRNRTYKPKSDLQGSRILAFEYFFLKKKTFRALNNTR